MVASAVGRQEIAVRVVLRHLFGDRDGLDDVGGAQLFQEIFRGRAERRTELDEAIDARDEIPGHRGAILHFLDVERAGRIDEERRAAADVIAQERYA